jgi:N-acetylmuramoyl-L-alanine amidase
MPVQDAVSNLLTSEPQISYEQPAEPACAPDSPVASAQPSDFSYGHPSPSQAEQYDVYPLQEAPPASPQTVISPSAPAASPPVYGKPAEKPEPLSNAAPLSSAGRAATGVKAAAPAKPKTGMIILIVFLAFVGLSTAATVGYFTWKRLLSDGQPRVSGRGEAKNRDVDRESTQPKLETRTPSGTVKPDESNRGVVVPPSPDKRPATPAKPARSGTQTPTPPIKDELLPESRTRNLTEADLKGKSAWELTLIRNEIYARHGYIFKRAELSSYFKKRSWYRPKTGDQDQIWRQMSETERRNVEFILEYQNRTDLRAEKLPLQDSSLYRPIQIASSNLLYVPRSPGRQSQQTQPSPPVRAPEPRRKQTVICIDPGHPSEVGIGTRGKKVTEVGVVWQVSLKVKKILEEEGWKVVLTKSREREFVRNRDRAMVANRVQADLMVRLHCDSTGGSGTATFFPDRQGVKQGTRGPHPVVIQRSRKMARVFHQTMMRTLKGSLRDRGLFPDTKTLIGSRQGALTGSIFSRVPVLLVEMCVLTHPADEAFIASEAGQRKIAQAIADGIRAAIQHCAASGE